MAFATTITAIDAMTIDIGYGGMFYAMTDGSRLGFRLTPAISLFG